MPVKLGLRSYGGLHVTQRVVEFCAYIPKDGSVEELVDYIYHSVQILDENGIDMIISKVKIKDSDYQC